MVAKPVALQVTRLPSIKWALTSKNFSGSSQPRRMARGWGDTPNAGWHRRSDGSGPAHSLAEIPQVFSGFSGHADTSELRDLIESFRSRIAPNSLQGPIADIGLIGTPVHANHSSDTVLGGDHCFSGVAGEYETSTKIAFPRTSLPTYWSSPPDPM